MDQFDNIEEWYRKQVENLSQKPDHGIWDSLDQDLTGDTPDVEDWYKQEVDKQSTTPDSSVWNQLSSRIGPALPVEEWYKKSIEDIDLEPSDSIIENIFHSLDVDNVWDRLEVSLHERDRVIWWRKVVFSITSIFGIITLGFFFLPDLISYQPPKLKETTNTLTNHTIQPLSNRSDINAEIHAKNGSNALITNAPTTNHQTTTLVSYQDDLADNGVNQGKTGNTTTPVPDAHLLKQSISTTTISPTIFHPAIYGEIDHIIDQPDLIVDKSKRPIFLHAGVGLDHSLLLNENTKEAFNINSTDYNQAVASSILSLGLGLPLNDQLNMEASISKFSQGHRFVLYREGKTVNHKMELNYLQGSVLFKLDRKNNYPVWNGKSLIGAYYGLLTSETSEINNEEQEDQITFNNSDFGLIAGYEIEKQLPLFNLGISLFYNQGITNILNENSNPNYSFDQTVNCGLNAKVQISVPIR